jgi:hypothetical protein
MMIAVVTGLIVLIPLLGLVTFVQVLYLESMRLRPRDLPSLKFFKDTLEDRIGLEGEDGAGCFSLVKHSLMIVMALLYFIWVAMLWEAMVAAWLTMLGASFALPQLLYRRTSGRWLLPLVPVLRMLAWLADARGKHRSTDFGGDRRRADRRAGPGADPVSRGVRRQSSARSDDA